LAPVREPLALHYRINGGYLPPDHWINDREHGGGRVLGEVCHFVDLLMFVAGSPVVEVMARGLGTTSRYSGDNVLVSLRFANGSEGTISYLANGDRSFSKERIEIFGGGSTAVLDDFRRLDLVRNGRTQTIRSRWRQDKGHHAEWAAFVDCIRLQKDLPISFEDMVCSTLATLRLEESRAAGEPMAVDLAGFLEDGQTGVLPQSNLHGYATRPQRRTRQFMLILGLNMFHADASAAIVLDGEVKFAIAEERLNRHKHFGGFPGLAVKACLDAVGAKISDVEHLAVGQDSDANLIRKVQYALSNPAKVLNFIRLRQRKEAMRDLRTLVAKALDVDSQRLKFQEHHLEHHIAHVASAYYCSPWEKAAGFSYDGSGDFVSTMMTRCEGNDIEVLERVFL